MAGSEAETGAAHLARVHVGLSIVVCDPDALRAYARRRHAACWFDPEWEPADLAQAVLEALVISNENPSPDEYGIEILNSQAQLRDTNPPPSRDARTGRSDE